jgi:hypothetical protein
MKTQTYRIPIENNSWDYVQGLIEKEINSAFKLRETPTMPTKKEIKKLTKKVIKKQRKEFLKQFEGKLEGPYDHLKEGVDYLDDIQRMKQ